MDQAQITADVTRARAKIGKLRGMDQLFKRKLGVWQSDTIMILKRIAQKMQKSGQGRKTGHMARNIGAKQVTTKDGAGVLVGTGPQIGQAPVVYASIQDKGGTIRPRKSKYLTVPMPGVKGIARNYPDSFVIKTKTGRLLICERTAKGVLRPLFSLRKEVKIPATGWFSRTMVGRTHELNRIMAPSTLVGELLDYGSASGIQD